MPLNKVLRILRLIAVGLITPIFINLVFVAWTHPTSLVLSCVGLLLTVFLLFIKSRITRTELTQLKEPLYKYHQKPHDGIRIFHEQPESPDSNIRYQVEEQPHLDLLRPRFIFKPWLRFYVIYSILILSLIGIGLYFVLRFAGKVANVWSFLLHHDLIISSLFVGTFLQFALRKRVYKNLTWKKLSDPWLKWSGVSTISVGGFGFIATNQNVVEKYLKFSTQSVDIKTYIQLYILLILLLGISNLLLLIGKSHAGNEETNHPSSLFLPTFLFVWTCNLGVYTFFFDCILLTLHANLTS